MNTEQKSILLELVASRRRDLDDSRRLAAAAYGQAHPVVGQLLREIARIDSVAAAVQSASVNAAA